jgi:hypothetical protein
MSFPQLARAFRVDMRAFVYSFESEKSQRKLLQNNQYLESVPSILKYDLHTGILKKASQPFQ